MKLNNRLIIPLLLTTVATISVAANLPGPDVVHYRNLKVLPKDISSKDLQEIMVDDFQDFLGVNCSYCHANSKDGHGLDFASDEKSEKEIARMMMRMTIRINRKDFSIKHAMIGNPTLIVTCNTCHKGQPFPAEQSGQ